MYLNFYGMSKEAFHIAPNPDFFYMSPGHREALAAVLYGVDKGLGFIVLTGEVGTGKTTVLRTYLERVRRAQIRPIYLFNSNQTFDSLLTCLLDQFEVSSQGQTEHWKIQALTRELVYELGRNRRVVLVIDEAHQMPVETFGKLHLISNLELPEQKLLQIVLTGQPELEEKLKDHNLRQIRQRIAVRARLFPLTLKEGIDYIAHRIQQSEAQQERVMTHGAMKAIVRAARGFPREINVLCDNALVTAFSYQAKPLTRKIAKRAIREFYQKPRRSLWRWMTAGAAAAAIVAFAGVAISMAVSQTNGAPQTELEQAHEHAVQVSAATLTNPSGEMQ